jgi:7,8-dihydro-6-hydroxymethylpterin-pyrophosphokinase
VSDPARSKARNAYLDFLAKMRKQGLETHQILDVITRLEDRLGRDRLERNTFEKRKREYEREHRKTRKQQSPDR